jgi:WD40 repeat protein
LSSYSDVAARLTGDLGAARARRAQLVAAGVSPGSVDHEILDLRHRLHSDLHLKEGDALGANRYTLIRRIGRGGFAVVWEALDRSLDRRVAIKILHGELAGDPLRRARFFRGARAMVALDHEAVARVLEPECEDRGYHYFVMELMSGGDMLRAVLEKRIGGEEQIIALIVRVGDALARAHGRKLVHRDVKPANILLDDSGAPKLCDFDLVGGADTTGGTRTGALGTFLYAAPELLSHPEDADARADVYGLAMTTIFGLHGANLPTAIMRDVRPLIGRLACRAAVKTVLQRAVDWSPRERFEHAGLFCAALLGARTAPLARVRPPPAQEAKQLQDAEKRSGGPVEPLFEPGEERVDGHRVLESRQPYCALGYSPTGQSLAVGFTDGTIRLLDPGKGAPVEVLWGRGEPVSSLAFNPRGTLMAVGYQGRAVTLWDVSSRVGRTLTSRQCGPVWSVAFSPGGELLAGAASDATIRIWEVASGVERRVLEGHVALITSVAFSPDGSALVSASADRTVRFWDARRWRVRGVLRGHERPVLDVAFRRDSRVMATAAADHTLRLWGADARIFRASAGVLRVSFSPDGTMVAGGLRDGTVRLWDLETGVSTAALVGRCGEAVTSVAFSPDGSTVAAATRNHCYFFGVPGSSRSSDR